MRAGTVRRAVALSVVTLFAACAAAAGCATAMPGRDPFVTDTAPFRNANYHEAGDTPDTLDYQKLARAVVGLSAVVEALASGSR